MKRQLVELEREIGLTTPLIAELDSRLTGHADATAQQIQSPTSPAAEPASSVVPTVKITEPEVSSSPAVEKLAAAVDSGLQMESPSSSSRSIQVCCVDAADSLNLLLSQLF